MKVLKGLQMIIAAMAADGFLWLLVVIALVLLAVGALIIWGCFND